MSIKKAGIILSSLVLVVIIVLITIKGFSINKKVEDVNTEDNKQKQEVSIEPSTGTNSNINSNSTGAPSFKEVVDPTLNELASINALVSSKKAFITNDNSYIYSVGVLVPNGEEFTIVNYYCPKKVYDSVSMGDSVKVDYQLDDSGRISIYSINRQ